MSIRIVHYRYHQQQGMQVLVEITGAEGNVESFWLNVGGEGRIL